MKNISLVVLFLSLSISLKAFRAVLHISATPSDSKIYIDNVLKGVGNVIITLEEAKEIQIKIEKEGFITQMDYYAYNVPKGTTSRKSYDRGDNYIVVELSKELKGQITQKKELKTEETNSLKEKGIANTIMIDGVYVFINSEPATPYETAFQFETKVIGGFSCPSIDDLLKAAVKNARKNGLPFDAVIIGNGKMDLAIRFK